jgi:hypothetical protein
MALCFEPLQRNSLMTIAEVGLVRFAKVALDSCQSRCAALSQPFQQAPVHAAADAGHLAPDALPGLDLLRNRSPLAEHRELQRALELRSVPDYTTLYRDFHPTMRKSGA